MISQLGIQTSRGYQLFTSGGTFTPTFTGTVYVTVIAGGAGNGAGHGKCHLKTAVAVTQGSPVTVTTGTGGIAGGGLGTDSAFGALSSSTGSPGGNGAVTVGSISPWGDSIGVGVAGAGGAVLVEW